MDKLFISLFLLQYTVADKVEKIKARREAGQGTLEYVGMIAVAAVIIVAVVTVLKGAKLGDWIGTFITSVKTAVSAP